ncbi:MAG: hypothetical protein P8X64_09870, partial [Anaerolineales bacterium]
GFNRAQIQLGEQEQIDLVERQAGFIEGTLNEFGPVLGVESLGEFPYEFHMRRAILVQGFDRTGPPRAAGVDTERIVLLAARQQIAGQ